MRESLTHPKGKEGPEPTYESYEAPVQLKSTFWVFNPRNNCPAIFEGKNQTSFCQMKILKRTKQRLCIYGFCEGEEHLF